MTAPHVLVVEDEIKIAAALRDYLRAAEFRVTVLDRGDGVVDWVRANSPDAILLDVMLPGRDGLSVCRDLRAFSSVPILMLTARVEEIDRLLGLEFGADDYICKPFSVREVVLRVRAVLRRVAGDSATAGQATVQLDHDRLEVRVRGQAMTVTPVEFRLLKHLMDKPGKVYSREQLQATIYSDHRIVSDRTVDSHVRNLRRKFAEHGLPEVIASVYGVGFRFELAEGD